MKNNDNNTDNKSVTNQWVFINKMLLIYKIVGIGLSILTIILSVLIFIMWFSDPIVVVESNCDKTFITGKRSEISITENDIKEFVTKWITLHYKWIEFDPETIIRNIEPITTAGLKEKLKKDFGEQKAQNTSDKSIEQNVSNVLVTLTDNEAIGTFDRIIRINGIPLVTPVEVALNIVQGSKTRWNPLGLYINGITEHEDK